MFGNVYLLSFLLCFIVFGCAKPHYENVLQPAVVTKAQDFKFTDCKAKFRESKNCLLWEWETLPTSAHAGALRFKIVRANALDDSALPVDVEGEVELILWMPSMGHGSTPVTIEPVDTGSFRADDVFFIMPGEWELKFQIKVKGVLQDEALVPLTV